MRTPRPVPTFAVAGHRQPQEAAEPWRAEWIRKSVSMAWANPDASREFVLANAQEMEPEVVQQHIDLYVNEFTLELGKDGFAAADALLQRAAAANLTPSLMAPLRSAGVGAL